MQQYTTVRKDSKFLHAMVEFTSSGGRKSTTAAEWVESILDTYQEKAIAQLEPSMILFLLLVFFLNLF